jgi:hypothetical protein
MLDAKRSDKLETTKAKSVLTESKTIVSEPAKKKPAAPKTQQASIASYLKPVAVTSAVAKNVDDDDEVGLSLSEMIARKKAEKRKEKDMPLSGTIYSRANLDVAGAPSPQKKIKSPAVDIGSLSDSLESSLNIAKKPAKPKTILIDSDEDMSAKVKPAAKKAAVAKKAPAKTTKPAPKPSRIIDDFDDVEDDDEPVVVRGTAPRRAAAVSKKPVQYVEISDDEEAEASASEGSFESEESDFSEEDD